MSEKKRVLHIFAEAGTGVLLLKPIIDDQIAKGYQVDLVCSNGEYFRKLSSCYKVHQIKISRKVASFSHFKAIIDLYILIRKNRYSIVHTHTPVASLLGRVAAFLARVPIIIYHMRGSWWANEIPMLTRAVYTIVEWIAGKMTTFIFTINCSDRESFVKYKIIKSDRIECLHCGSGGIDTNRFSIETVPAEIRENLRKFHKIQANDFIVCFIGRIVREKGVVELLNAFNNVQDDIAPAKLLFIGGVLNSERDKSTIEYVKKTVENDQRLKDCVLFIGFDDDVNKFIAIADVVVLPSYREGFGIVLAEAASMGKPVIASRTRGAIEAVDQNFTGLLVPVGDTEELGQAIIEMKCNNNLRFEMGKNARKKALEVFDQKVVMTKINETYVKLLELKGKNEIRS